MAVITLLSDTLFTSHNGYRPAIYRWEIKTILKKNKTMEDDNELVYSPCLCVDMFADQEKRILLAIGMSVDISFAVNLK